MNLTITDVHESWLSAAVDAARDFNRNYPDRIGIRQGCAYSHREGPIFYVYRTKSMIIVRGD